MRCGAGEGAPKPGPFFALKLVPHRKAAVTELVGKPASRNASVSFHSGKQMYPDPRVLAAIFKGSEEMLGDLGSQGPGTSALSVVSRGTGRGQPWTGRP